MTIAPERLRAETSGAQISGVDPSGVQPTRAPEEPRLPHRRIAACAALSACAGAWVAGGLLQSASLARAVGALGVAIGVGLMALSTRSARPALLQYAVLPVSAIVGALLIAPDAQGGTANIFGLVGEALHSGGLREPPVAFDPGWRFVLVVLFAITGAGAVAVATSMRNAAFAVIAPLPIVLGGALLQPKGAELTSSTVGVFLMFASLGVAYGSELVGRGATSSSFELRRLLRGAAMLGALMVVMVGLGKASLLFPDTNKDRVIPPQRPPASPPEPDRELFRVAGESPGPWRVGVLDVFDGRGWLLPPYDRGRNVEMVGGAVPDVATARGSHEVRFHVSDLRGVVLPVPAGAIVVRAPEATTWDPRIGVPLLERRIPQGLDYTAVVRPPPDGRAMTASASPPQTIIKGFVEGNGTLPPAPGAILSMLERAPNDQFDRLQFLRDQLYANVTAAGGGSPIDVPPARVVAMLAKGVEASPYEIVAAEALLARWAGVPSRIGYGYYGGDRVADGSVLHPRDARVWLEAYFTPYGWVPLVGTPVRAKPSDSSALKNVDPRVRPSDELALTVFIPTERHTIKQLFEVVRFWIAVATPFVVGVIALIALWPALLKARRSRKRARWGHRNAPLGRILVSYAELRDLCCDLNIGETHEPPLSFLRWFRQDDQLEELSWLVTRALWGDLRRDIRAEDVEACDDLVASVRARLLHEQTLINGFLAKVSRASLRAPYTSQIPNCWHPSRARAALRAASRAVRRAVRPRILHGRRPARATTMMLGLVMLASSCSTGVSRTAVLTSLRFPERIAPATLLGYTFKREAKAEAQYAHAGVDSLVAAGEVFTVRLESVVQASLQISVLKPKVDTSSTRDRDEIERSIGGSFEDFRLGIRHIRVRREDERTLYLWFPPASNTMELLVARKKFTDVERLLRGIIAYQLGLPVDLVAGRNSSSQALEPGQTPSTAPGAPGIVPDVSCPTSRPNRDLLAAPQKTTRMTLVPGGAVSDRIRVEARVGIHNSTSTERTYAATFYLDREDEVHRIGDDTVTVQPGAAGLASVTFATAGYRGAHKVLYRLSGGARVDRGSQPLTVLSAIRRGLPRLQAAWLDPLGLSQGVYLRDCPVRHEDVRSMMDAMHGVGMDTIVITYAEYQGHFFYPSAITFYDRDIRGISQGQLFDFDLLGTVLDQADRNDMRVMLGLGRGGDTGLMESIGRGGDERISDAIALGGKVANELWTRYGGHDSFYGWYLTHESSEIPRAGAYYDPLADTLHELSPDKPVMIAPTGTPEVDVRSIRESHVDIFAYQDAVGAGYDGGGGGYTYDPEVRIAQLDEAFGRYRSIHDEADKHLWADLEVWEMDGSHGYSNAYPARFGRVRRQLAIEAKYADVISGYEWAGFLQAPNVRSRLNDPRALALFRAYAAYVRRDPR